MNTSNTYDIESISFGLYSPDEIYKMSVCKIDCTKKNMGYGTVYDPRMGTTSSSQICETCEQNGIKCPGHFGYIDLHKPVVHPLYYKQVTNLINCFCFKCCRLMVTKEQILLYALDTYKPDCRLNKIIDKIKKVDVCCQQLDENDENGFPKICGAHKNDVKFSTIDMSYFTVHTDSNNKINVPLSVNEIKRVFDNIPDEDVRLMGSDPLLVHPRNLIISLLPVLPPCDRPYVQAASKICDDDLTNQYIEIIKSNNILGADYTHTSKIEMSDAIKSRAYNSLKFRILTTFNNGQGKAKNTTNGRPVKGIKERLTGKDGQIRNNMMGKRCNQTGRTVIGPGPDLKMGYIGLPKLMASNLSVPVYVNAYNIDALQALVDSGIINTVRKDEGETIINIERYRMGTRLLPGDVIIRCGKRITFQKGMNNCILKGDNIERNGEHIQKIKYSNRVYPLSIGWIVDRPLRDHDYVLLNRQPTLHKASMLAMQIKVTNNKTIQMNLSVTKPFNADFDGDEMNIHVPQTLESQTELKYLSSASNNLISPQSSKPNMAIVQDSLLGAYIMTYGTKSITRAQFSNITMKLPPFPCRNGQLDDAYMSVDYVLKRQRVIRSVLVEKGKRPKCYTGKGLVSMILPNDFNYMKTNDINKSEPTVRIYKGVMYEGTLCKLDIGASHNSIHHLLNKEYGPTMAAFFLDCIQFITNEYLLINGFTVGLGDCLITKTLNTDGISKEEEIKDVIHKCYIEAEGIKRTTIHPNIREIRINAALNKAKDIGLSIAKKSLSHDNNFISTVNSGSKGDFFNIAQITGLLGQQNLRGKRVPLSLNNGTRSLPHYPFGEMEPSMEYESRGFIDRGFSKGLSPRQFYFHAMSGREGITDTAMGTATSGYMQRRIVKLTEDIKIHNDYTVRDSVNNIYQMAYGNDNIDPVHTVKIKNRQEFCNVSRVIEKLNMNHESLRK